jgi:hypothetical protein
MGPGLDHFPPAWHYAHLSRGFAREVEARNDAGEGGAAIPVTMNVL